MRKADEAAIVRASPDVRSGGSSGTGAAALGSGAIAPS